MFVDGEAREAFDGARFESIDPATEAVVASLPQASSEDVDAAVAAARRAFEGPWSRVGPGERQRMLERLAELLVQHGEELAQLDSLEMGAPLSGARRFVAVSAEYLEWYAAAARTIRGQTIENSRPAEMMSYTLRQPVGVVGAITPWNSPLLMMIWKLGAVLATGSTLVHKPAEWASLSALRVARLCLDAGVPSGVVNVITGDGRTGAALASHDDVDKVAFTGSVSTGQEIIRASAGNVKRLTLELGGKSPNIVFADADLDRAVAGAAMSIFGNSGQVCTAGSRLLVHRSVYEEFLDRLKERARSIVVGDPRADTTEMGPVASHSQMERVMRYVDEGEQAGATLVTGGGRPAGCKRGYFVEPTIFSDVTDQMTIAQDEIFGPVLAATPFDSTDEAIASANSTRYGLASYVWTENLRTAHEVSTRIRAGKVSINSLGLLDGAVPVGGWGMSGYGKELGFEQLDEYLATKAVWVAR